MASRIMRLVYPKSPQPLGESLEVIDVIGRGIAGEASQFEITGANAAELLHAEGTPAQNRSAMQAELGDEEVSGLGGAGEGAGEDLGVSDEHLLAAGDRLAGKVEERRERFEFDGA